MMKSKAKKSPGRRKSYKPRGPAPAENPDPTVVAIGASAGGIEALTELITHLPADTGMAFVLIQHLDPNHHSILTELLARKTSIPVREVSDGLLAAANHIYVIPPNSSMSISGNTLHLGPRVDSRGLHMAVDQFMRSLAEQKGNRAVGVILSGTGSDGTLGIAEIQAHGGVTFAQDEASAKYYGMPHSAVASGNVDYVLPPKQIAAELARIARHPYVAPGADTEAAETTLAPVDGLATIFQILHRVTGVDFTHYRRTTLMRRIQRRMVVHNLKGMLREKSLYETGVSDTSFHECRARVSRRGFDCAMDAQDANRLEQCLL